MSPHEFQILVALAGQARHGYAIMQAVEAQTAGDVVIQTGALYRLLKRMLNDGRIVEVDAPRDADTTDERRRYYRLAPAGRRAVAEEAARMRAALHAAQAARLVAGEDA